MLDAATFEEIEANRAITGQALGVVLVASLAAGAGGGILGGPAGLLRAALGALIGWVMWAAVTYVIGARLLPEPQTRTDLGELLRVIGFAYAPGLFGILGFIPVLGVVVSTVVAIWLLVTMVLAVRQALDYTSTIRAFLVVLIGWLVFVAITLVFQGPWVF